MLMKLAPALWVNPDSISSVIYEPESRSYVMEFNNREAIDLSVEEWQRIEPLLVADPSNPVPQGEDARLLEYLSPWTHTASLSTALAPHEYPSALPQPIVEAVTAVEHARAQQTFVTPIAELNALYAACRDALPTPRVMKRED